MLLEIIYSGFFTWIVGYLLIPFLRKYVIDKPNQRSSHKEITPTSGGMIFILPICASSIFSNNLTPLICLPLAIIGLLDDIFNLNSLIRYLSQLITVILIFYNSNLLIYSLNSGNLFFSVLIPAFFIFIGTAIINFINFMDGLDGMVAGSMLSIFLLLPLINIESNNGVIVGSLSAFLIFNWSPAKVFMGDIGSTFLAALYISTLFNQREISSLYLLLIPLCPFWFDCISCIIMKLITHQNIFKPHKLHLYQRLNQAGWSHASVSTLYIVTTIILFIICTLNNLLISTISSLFVIIIGFYLDKKFAKPFKQNHKKR